MRFSKDKGYFSTPLNATFLLIFPVFPEVNAAIFCYQPWTCTPAMDMAWKREAVATSPPKGMQQMLKWRNNPTTQPKTIKVKLLQDKAEPRRRRTGRRLASGRWLPWWHQAPAGPVVAWSPPEACLCTWLLPCAQNKTLIPLSKLLKHLSISCCILFASPDPARMTEVAEPVAWPDCRFPSRCKMAPSFLSFYSQIVATHFSGNAKWALKQQLGFKLGTLKKQ